MTAASTTMDRPVSQYAPGALYVTRINGRLILVPRGCPSLAPALWAYLDARYPLQPRQEVT